jgi:NAD(P)-dependent dehydrogenase (short-subunit alcohol dehydrogenase family)
MNSTDTNTWLVTGAGRGMGVEFARAALTGSALCASVMSNSATSSRSCSPTADLTDGHTTYAGDEPRRPLCVEQ